MLPHSWSRQRDDAGIVQGTSRGAASLIGEPRPPEGRFMQLSTPPAIDLAEGSAEPDAGGPARKLPGSQRSRQEAVEPGRHRPVTERIACWSARHAALALIAWLVMAAGAVLAGHLYGTQSQPQYDPGRSGAAQRMLDQLHVVTPPSESVLIQPRVEGRTYAADPAMRRATSQVVAALRAMPGTAARIRSPLNAGGSQMIARGGRAALVTFQVAGPHGNVDATVVRALRAVASVQARFPGLVVAEAGDASIDRAANAMMGQDFRKAELTSIPITLLLLLIVFGAVIAAGIPVLLAGGAVMTTVSLLAIPSRWLPIGPGTSEVVLIIGMAVGVDYTLFYLRREREERAAGASFHAALRTAAATSGRAIVVSGLTVMISLAGLLFTGIDMFTGFAIGTIGVVGVAVAGSLTALPALLSLIGPWSDRGRLPLLGKARTSAERSLVWAALSAKVVRRPLLWGAIAVAALGALAIPALGMRIGSPAINLPSSLPVVRTLTMIEHDFPGGPAPAQVVVTGPGVRSGAMSTAVADLRAMAARPGGAISGPVSALPVGGGRGAVVTVPLAGSGKDARSFSALRALRGRILPATLGRVRGVRYAVTGDTANSFDYRTALRSAAPLVFGLVAGLAL